MSDERYEGPPKSHVEVWSDQYIETQQRMLRDAIKKARREQMERDCKKVSEYLLKHLENDISRWVEPELIDAIRQAFEEKK